MQTCPVLGTGLGTADATMAIIVQSTRWDHSLIGQDGHINLYHTLVTSAIKYCY